MPRRTRQTIPANLHNDDREVVGFLTGLIDYQPYLVPTGQALRHFALVIPDGFLACDGVAVSRTTYAALFQAIGTAHGTGDGSTTFNVPNAAGFVIKT